MAGTDDETDNRRSAIDADPAARRATNTICIWMHGRRRQGFRPSSDDTRQEIRNRWPDFSPAMVQAIEEAVEQTPFTPQTRYDAIN
jgi:hypothetical protein